MSRKNKDWLEAFLEYMDNTEPSYLYKLWCGINVIAAALQRKCWVPWGTITFYPNLYIVLIGPPGRTRKGTAMGPAMELLETLDIPISAEATTREALIRSLADAKTVTVDNDTGKSTTHSSLTIFSPELTVFLGYQNQQLMGDLCDWYDCRNRWTYHTKTQGSDDIRGVWVNLIGATTPELIRTTLPMDAIGGGLTSRIIFVNETKKAKSVPAPFLSQEQLDIKKDLIYDLEQIHMLKGSFKITTDFLAHWCEWYEEQDQNPPIKDPFFDGYVSRRANHVMKLSMILSAARRNSMIIEDSDLTDAINILERTEIRMPETFQGVGHSPQSATLTSIMTTIGNTKKISRTDLLKSHYRDVRDEKEFDSMLQMLEGTNWIKRTVIDGKPYIIYTGKVK